ncbi:amidohydrolase family protein [Pedobacter sp. Leaf176]|uniref:amidohydrolase family protein n=1 Tax=Pedobacter sp. Leaf176 TaxID=1736286 RepID=UPI0018D24415|nr:amidohydrolase family protein [Pedobacter sp. Leaf176]
MKTKVLKLAVGILMCLGFSLEKLHAFTRQSTDTSMMVLKNVNVLDFKQGKFIKKKNVAVSNGLILSTNYPARKLKGLKVLDLSGKYLVPGLIDAHVHVSALTKNNINTTYSHLNYYLKHGVTTVRDASGDGAALLEAQKSIKSGRQKGANVFFAAVMAGDWYYNRGIGLHKNEPYQPWRQLITDQTDLDSAMTVAKSCGATGVKLYHSFDKVLLTKVVSAAKKHGLKTWGHLMMYPATPIEVVASGVEVPSHVFMLENLVSDAAFLLRKTKASYKEDLIAKFDITDFCNIMKSKNAILDATLCVSEDRDPWIFTILKKIHEQGVEIAAGTDQIVDLNRPNPRLLDELSSFVDKCGFINIDAIKSATLINAKIIGEEKRLGSIENGKVADLLVLNGNPLSDIRELGNIKLVMQSGKIAYLF